MEQSTQRRLLELGVLEEQLRSRDLSNTNLSQHDLRGMDLRGFHVAGTKFEYADLSGCDLRGVNFASTNCISTRFCGCDLRGAVLSFGYFNSANFSGADLRGTVITDSLCSAADFSGADLRGAVFGDEYLDCDFQGCDLSGVHLPTGVDRVDLGMPEEGNRRTDSPSRPKPESRPQRPGSETTDNRNHSRLQIGEKVVVVDPTTKGPVGELVDVSASGCRLNRTGVFKAGGFYRLRVILPQHAPSGKDTLDLEVLAVWCNRLPGSPNHSAGFRIENANEIVVDTLLWLGRTFRRIGSLEIRDSSGR